MNTITTRIWLVLFTIVFGIIPAHAQDPVPTVEVAGGYVATVNSRDFSSYRNEVAKKNGWYASVVGNGNEVFGVEGQVTGSYAPGIDLFSVGFGPRFSYRESRTVTPYGHALVGVTKRDICGWKSDYLSAVIGGGLQVNVGKGLGMEGGLDYRRSVRGFVWDEFQIRVGVVFRSK